MGADAVKTASAITMKKNRKGLIEKIQLITSLLALAITIMGLIKRFMDWTEN